MKLRYPLATLVLAFTAWHILSTYRLSGAAAYSLTGLTLLTCGALLDRWSTHLSKRFGAPELTADQLDAMTTEDILTR